MKNIALVLSIIASAFVLTSCANKGTEQTTATSDTSSQVSAAPAKHHRHHRDYKGEAAAK